MSTAQPKHPGSRPHSPRPAYTNRLAELVVHLTDCAPERAIKAVESQRAADPVDADAALAIVARAMCAVRRVDLREQVDLRDSADVSAPTT